MRTLVLLLLLGGLLTACGDKSDAEIAAEDVALAAQNQAYQTMQEGHDRVMPMMGQITQAQRSIAEELTSGTLDEDRRELLIAVNEQLEDAEDGMSEWMQEWRSLDELRADRDADDIMEYLDDHTAEMARVESKMKSSLAAAQELIGGTHDHSGPGHEDHDH